MSKHQNAYCSFCKKSFKEVGPLVEGPEEVNICGECIELCQSIVLQENFRRSNDPNSYFEERIHYLVDSVGSEIHTINPRLHELARKAVESRQPSLFSSITDLCESTALLRIIAGILERIKAKNSDPDKLALLEQVTSQVARLKTEIDAEADRTLKEID